MVLQLLRELVLVGGLWWDHFPVFGVLEDGSVPVVGAHCPEQDAILWYVKEGRLRHTQIKAHHQRERKSPLPYPVHFYPVKSRYGAFLPKSTV